MKKKWRDREEAGIGGKNVPMTAVESSRKTSLGQPVPSFVCSPILISIKWGQVTAMTKERSSQAFRGFFYVKLK